jgi:hypothetical protein
VPEVACSKNNSTRFSLAGVLIGVTGFCVALAGLSALVSATGGFPDPARQSDFFFELLTQLICGSCCILASVCLVTFAAIAYVTPRGGKRHGD